jgi:hypothetical protein
MRTVLAAVVALCAVPVQAQSLKFELNVGDQPGAAVRVEASETRTSTRSFSNDDYAITGELNPTRETIMQVLEPQGARCEVWMNDREKGTFEIPFTLKPHANRPYKYVVYLPNGRIFEQLIEVRDGELAKLYVKRGTKVASVVVQLPVVQLPVIQLPVERERERLPPPGPSPMSPSEFSALVGAVQAESFPDQRVGAVEAAVPHAYFTVAQVGELVALMDFPNDKVRVVEITRSKIVDRQNGYQLLQRFDFPNDKDRVKQLLASAQ